LGADPTSLQKAKDESDGCHFHFRPRCTRRTNHWTDWRQVFFFGYRTFFLPIFFPLFQEIFPGVGCKVYSVCGCGVGVVLGVGCWVCCRVLQCAECCSVQMVLGVRCCSVLQCSVHIMHGGRCCCVMQCIAVCCSMLQCVAVCCSVLQCVSVQCAHDAWGEMLQCVMCDVQERGCAI